MFLAKTLYEHYITPIKAIWLYSAKHGCNREYKTYLSFGIDMLVKVEVEDYDGNDNDHLAALRYKRKSQQLKDKVLDVRSMKMAPGKGGRL